MNRYMVRAAVVFAFLSGQGCMWLLARSGDKDVYAFAVALSAIACGVLLGLAAGLTVDWRAEHTPPEQQEQDEQQQGVADREKWMRGGRSRPIPPQRPDEPEQHQNPEHEA